VRPFGISRDSAWTHIAWAQTLDLNFPLLSDWNGEATRAFGRRQASSAVITGQREVCVLVDADGTVARRMALRNGRGAGLRRVASRPRRLRSARRCALPAAAGLPRRGRGAALPLALHVGRRAGERRGVAGDHLQTLLPLLARRPSARAWRARRGATVHVPAEAKPQPNYAGWPFGFLFWPLGARIGRRRGWNLLQLVVYVLAACSRARGCASSAAARAGARRGLVFAIAPYRVQQSVGHLLGPISILLPRLAVGFRARAGFWLSAARPRVDSALGQVHRASARSRSCSRTCSFAGATGAR
jgi:hypothetical protein